MDDTSAWKNAKNIKLKIDVSENIKMWQPLLFPQLLESYHTPTHPPTPTHTHTPTHTSMLIIFEFLSNEPYELV